MSAQADIWMPLYPRDYLTATAELSIEQSGAYLHLLMHSWSTGGALPDDDAKLARICRVTQGRFQRTIKPDVMAFFDLGQDGWTQKRLEKERHRAHEKSATASENAKAKWRKTKETPHADAYAKVHAEPMRNGCSSPSPLEKKERVPPTPHENTQPDAPAEPSPRTPLLQVRSSAATRLPGDWQPDAAMAAYAKTWGLNPARVALDFRGYWLSRTGAAAAKADWPATWQRWCRTEADRMGTTPPDLLTKAKTEPARSADPYAARPRELVNGAL
jgi:uncharacterized protein YdaU (DUF1376 family)